jgi:hypothetical protein
MTSPRLVATGIFLAITVRCMKFATGRWSVVVNRARDPLADPSRKRRRYRPALGIGSLHALEIAFRIGHKVGGHPPRFPRFDFQAIEGDAKECTTCTACNARIKILPPFGVRTHFPFPQTTVYGIVRQKRQIPYNWNCDYQNLL